LVCHVDELLADRKLTEREIGASLGIKQPEVSHLINEHFSRFTTDKLLGSLKHLNRKLTTRIGV
jgi:predicted XRE-type DNA-binding protein